MKLREVIVEQLQRDSLLSFNDIARMTVCSREYVRQVARSIGILGLERAAVITPAKRKKAEIQKVLAVGYKPATFRAMVRSWLLEIGCGYCGYCRMAKPLDDMGKSVPSSKYRCKRCMADANMARYHDESTGYKEKCARWQKDNPDKCRKYAKKYNDKKKGRVGENGSN